jgi:hypothetical protein
MRGVYEDHSEIDRPPIEQPILDQHCEDRVGEAWLDAGKTLRETCCSDN